MNNSVEIHFVRELTFHDLMDELWGEAYDNACIVDREGKGDDFMALLEQWKDEEALTGDQGYWEIGQVNDFLWFGWENVRDALGIEEEEDVDVEDEEE